MRQRALRVAVSISGVAIITLVAHELIPVNATTVGFAYLLFVLIIASVWGFLEASLSSIPATLLFNYYFLRPFAHSRSRIRRTGSLCSAFSRPR